jgi:hypothetical protein
MRHFVRVLVAVTSLLTVSYSTSALVQAVDHDAATDQAFVEQQLFSTSLSAFVATASSQNNGDTWFDWSTDYCSAPGVGNTGRTFNFTNPCRRHDFGYRNTQLIEERYGIDSWNSASRKRIDLQFLSDLKAHCASRRLIDRPTCYTWAYTYYNAVRVAGGP